MSTRTARIEIHPARFEEPDAPGVEWADDAAPPSQRPHYLRLVAANGQVLAHSENYSSRSNARRAAKALRFFMYDVLALDDPDAPLWAEFDANGERTR